MFGRLKRIEARLDYIQRGKAEAELLIAEAVLTGFGMAETLGVAFHEEYTEPLIRQRRPMFDSRTYTISEFRARLHAHSHKLQLTNK